jgi:hypothetical protein
MLLNNNKYGEKFQIKMWATYYHVYDYLVKNGRRESKKIFPKPIVEYFVNWRKVNKEAV